MQIALEKIHGSYIEQFGGLHHYEAELVRPNQNNTVKFKLILSSDNSEPLFQRIYIGPIALREGFLQGCRPFICLDGCFLKTPHGGELLSAVGRDGNNKIFPIAWAVVEKENTEVWIWFLKLLMADIGHRWNWLYYYV